MKPVYDTLAAMPLAEHRKTFETNHWGTVHGSLAAWSISAGARAGGTLISVGSVNGDVAIP